MMKHSRSGRKRSESHQRESSVLEKKTTSGSMGQDLVDHVQRSTMTVERNMDVASPDCTVGCDCDRYMEVWNNVFTQFENDGHNHYTELENKNIDTGMGLERLAVVVQDVDSIFDVDTIKAIRDEVCEMSAGSTYGTDARDRCIDPCDYRPYPFCYIYVI